MKKWISTLLIAAMMLTLVACGNEAGSGTNSGETDANPAIENTENESGEENAAASEVKNTEEMTIGINYFGSASYALLLLKKNSEVVVEAYGQTPMSVDDEFNIEKIVTDVENMIQSGVDGIVFWGPNETLFPTISQMCKEAKIPFVLCDKAPSDQGIIDELLENPYFAGAITPDNASYGKGMAEYALEEGCKTAIIAAPGVGDASGTPRLEAFQATFEAGGGTILEVTHSDDTASGQTKLEDALVANPNPDVIYATGSDFGIAAMNAVINMGSKDTLVLTSDFDETVLGALGAGKLEILNGDSLICGTYSAIILENYLAGTPFVDENGKSPWITDVSYFFISPEQIDLYDKFWIQEHCYSDEEMRNMCTAYNPEFAYEDFLDAVHNYGLAERLQAKLAEGKVTEEELKAAGIE